MYCNMLEKVERYDNIITYERKSKKMANGNNNSQIGIAIEKLFTFIKEKFLELLILGFTGWIVWVVHDLPERVDELDKSVSNIETRLDILEGNYKVLNSQVWSINKITLNGEKSFGSELEIKPEVLLASSDFSIGMISGQASGENSEKVITDMEAVEDSVIIGTSVEGNEDKTKGSMKDIPFIMQYTENGEEVFFCGKYNENSQWDGECIINRYKNSKLTFIMEAFYDNGELKEYQQVFRGYNTRKQEIWYVSKREVEGTENSGETTTYFFYGDCEKNFEDKSVKKEDLLSVNKFVETIPSNIEGYYNGYTSDGKYNDESGNAYLIKYKTDGNVRFLYEGKIENGYPHDNTGNAWSIAWGNGDDGYYYYKGTFTEGEHGNPPKNWQPMTQEEINEKVNPDDYPVPLTGLIE